MWPVSDRFLTALASPHKTVQTLTVTPPGGDPLDVAIKSGSIAVDASSRIRRRGTLTLVGDSTVYEAVSAPGCIFEMKSGLNFGSSTETVPLFYGEATDPAQNWGDGTIGLTVADRGNNVARSRLLTPYAPLSATTRVAAIAAMVQGAIPTAQVIDQSTDTGTIGSAQVWAENRWDVIADLSKDGGTEAFFRADGTFVIRDQPTTTAASVWSIKAGAGGTLKSVERNRPTDRMYNTVVVRPATTDGTQTWAQQVAQITDTNHPLHPSKVGVIPYFWASPTIRSAATAYAAGVRILDRVSGSFEMLSLESIANPALEASDVVRAITPTINTDSARIFQHFIDSYSIDLNTASMRIATRSQVITDD